MTNKLSPSHHELVQAFLQLKSETEIQIFLLDILTLSELDEFAKRFLIAKMLWTTQQSYQEIAKKVETSTATVTRVAHGLFKEGNNGYQTVLKKIYPQGPVRKN
jgi:TrpR-related protein YerC/YecD